jgi:hypothetical protein
MNGVAGSSSLLFPLGDLVATPNALNALRSCGFTPMELIGRHCVGDWGDLPLTDAQANFDALRRGGRLLSSYLLADGTKVWVITEADRSMTTVLLPSEY